MSLANRPQQNGPFTKLPAELRIIIYGMAFEDVTKYITKQEFGNRSARTKSQRGPRSLPIGALALPFTCYVLHQESIAVMKSLLQDEDDKLSSKIVHLGSKASFLLASPHPSRGTANLHSRYLDSQSKYRRVVHEVFWIGLWLLRATMD